MGKLLITVGVVLIIVGLVVTYGGRLPFLGKLPGDIRIEKENFKFYFPITTSILLSVLLTLALYLYNKFRQ